MIPTELLKKYHMAVLEEYKQIFGDNIDTERVFYETFLKQTDHIPAKLFEAFIETMTSDNVSIGNMIKFLKDVKTEYADVLAARKTAREEINRIESELAAGK